MEKEKKSVVVPIILVVLVGLVFQAMFIGADTRDTPNKAVVKFAKAYYKLDPSMSELLCNEKKIVDDVDVVDEYINMITEEGKSRGYGINRMKNKLYHIETHTIAKNENNAQIQLTGKRRVSINPVYTIVAQIFFLSDSYEVDETFNVIKEDGRWKICGGLL